MNITNTVSEETISDVDKMTDILTRIAILRFYETNLQLIALISPLILHHEFLLIYCRLTLNPFIILCS